MPPTQWAVSTWEETALTLALADKDKRLATNPEAGDRSKRSLQTESEGYIFRGGGRPGWTMNHVEQHCQGEDDKRSELQNVF